MDEQTKQAIKVLGTYSAGRYDVWSLAGSARASCRAHVMSTLLGVKTPRSKSGVNAIRQEFYDRLGITGTGGCPSEREDSFIAICKTESEAV